MGAARTREPTPGAARRWTGLVLALIWAASSCGDGPAEAVPDPTNGDCEGAAADCAACVSGDQRCASLHVAELCDGGVWVAGLDCSGYGEVCFAGACIDPCTPKAEPALSQFCPPACPELEEAVDWDGDGFTDCDCPAPTPLPLDVPVIATWDDPPPQGFWRSEAGPWLAEVRWSWPGLGGTRDDVVGLPAVGVGPDGNVQVVVHVSDEGAEPALVALSGVDGAERWALDGFAANSGAAIIDVQSDGVAEIVALDISGRLTALAWDGAEVWKSDEKVEAFGAQPLVTDLDGDGWPEVVAGDGVFEGDDGALRFRMTENLKPGLTLPAVGDLDLDGAAEIYLGQYRYAGDGSAAEVLPFANATGQFLAVADVDGTPEGELVVASSGFVQLRRHDGELVVAVPNVTTNAGPPCVADFDGDGVSEIVKPGGDVLTMLELTGELGWTQPTQDLSGLAGCSGFDLDGDGAAEVLYADESVFQILDGRTGTPLAGHFIGYTSSTVWAYPVVADVDGDGAAEIVLVHDDQDPLGPSAAVTVVGHPTAGWMPAGPHWPVHDFSGSNVGAGGKVASSGAAPPWQTGNLHRARAGLRPRLGVEIVGGCWTACEPTPTLGLGMQVHNDGTEAVEGLTWHLFDPTARSAEALAAGEISGPLEPGARSPMAHAGAELPGSSLELRVFGVGRHSGALVEAWAIWTAEQDGCPETAEEAQ